MQSNEHVRLILSSLGLATVRDFPQLFNIFHGMILYRIYGFHTYFCKPYYKFYIFERDRNRGPASGGRLPSKKGR